jgi:hypothetical protein
VGNKGFNGGLFLAAGPQAISVSEAELRRRIHLYLNRSLIQNAVTDARNVGSQGRPRFAVYPAGWPDITASLPLTGRAWGIEIKTETGELRDSQKDLLPCLTAGGWLISVVRSVEEVSHELKIQLSLLDHRALDDYFVRVRQLHSEAAARAVLRESVKRARKASAR